jgi:hypothetical protein
VLGLFACFALACAVFVLPTHGAPAFVACVAALTVLMTLVCWLTGEPPKWRWGDD